MPVTTSGFIIIWISSGNLPFLDLRSCMRNLELASKCQSEMSQELQELQLIKLFGVYTSLSSVARGAFVIYITLSSAFSCFQHLQLVFWALWHWQVITDKWQVVGGTTNLELPRHRWIHSSMTPAFSMYMVLMRTNSPKKNHVVYSWTARANTMMNTPLQTSSQFAFDLEKRSEKALEILKMQSKTRPGSCSWPLKGKRSPLCPMKSLQSLFFHKSMVRFFSISFLFDRWTFWVATEVQLAALQPESSLISIAELICSHTSNGCCLAVSRPIHKNKLFSFRSENSFQQYLEH